MRPLTIATILLAGVAAIGGLYAAPRWIASGGGEVAAGPARPASTAALSALGAAATGPLAALETAEDPAPPPDTRFLDPDGAEIGFGAFRGEVVLVNLWATWCAPCVREMPAIDRLASALSDRPFRVVAISLDRGGPEKPAAFLERIGAERLALYRDPTFQVARDLGAPGLPVTVILDRAGREVARLTGEAAWDAPEAQAAIELLLDDGADGAQ